MDLPIVSLVFRMWPQDIIEPRNGAGHVFLVVLNVNGDVIRREANKWSVRRGVLPPYEGVLAGNEDEVDDYVKGREADGGVV